MLDWIEIWEFRRPSQHFKLVVVLLKPFMSHFCFVAGRSILLKEATATRETVSMKGCTWSATMLIGGTCQSNIHMEGRTQGLPAEHCPKNHTASTGLPSSHSASWCHVFPR